MEMALLMVRSWGIQPAPGRKECQSLLGVPLLILVLHNDRDLCNHCAAHSHSQITHTHTHTQPTLVMHSAHSCLLLAHHQLTLIMHVSLYV